VRFAVRHYPNVIPANAGIHCSTGTDAARCILAFAGMTPREAAGAARRLRRRELAAKVPAAAPMTSSLPRLHFAPGKAIAYSLSAILCLAVLDAQVKWLAADYAITQIAFLRYVVGVVLAVAVAARHGGLRQLRTRRPFGHALRSLLNIATMLTFYAALQRLPLADVIAIAFAAPLFMTVLSVPLLGERVGIRRWSAVIVGFVGVLIMTRPGAGVFDPAALLPLSAALLYAVAMIAIRKLSHSEPAATIVFYFTVIGATAGALSLPFQWHTPDAVGLATLVGIGLLGGGAQITMTLAFRVAPVALLAPFGYAGLVFAMGFGYLIWGEVPDAYLLLGAAIVVGSGLYILHRETTLARRRAMVAPAPV